MKLTLLAAGLAALWVLSTLGGGAGGGAPALAEEEKPAAKAPEDAARAELEKKFQETLGNSVLTGRWRLVEDGKLGEEREEKYTIGAVTKAAGDLWLIQARIQYGGKDVTIPVPVTVKWAGDTPVIQVTNAGLPGLGTYTARVMVYNDLYSGTWFGSRHGGFLSGSIARQGGGE
jgi:hypothetical protein